MNQTNNNYTLNDEQFEQLKERYVDTIVDNMSVSELEQYVLNELEDFYDKLSESEVINEIKDTYNEEKLDEFITIIKEESKEQMYYEEDKERDKM